MSLTPKSPLRADHRFLQRFISVVLGGKVENIPEEFSRVSQVFVKAGGSWKGIFLGSPKDMDLLRRILKVAQEKGYLTKKHTWGANG